MYNFGVGGSGAQQMLARLENGSVEKAVESPPRHVFYLWFINHVRRAAGLELMSLGGPRYVLDTEGRARRDGNFEVAVDGQASRPRSVLFEMLSRSALFSAVHGGTLGYAEDADLLAAIVAASRDHVERVWPEARFHVIFWDDPLSLKHAVMRARFEQRGLSMIRVSGMLPGLFDDEDAYRRSREHQPRSSERVVVHRRGV